MATHPLITALEKSYHRALPEFRPGDTVRVHFKILEGDKLRTQAFEGVVIARRRGGNRGTLTVRKISFGQGVERIFPMASPQIEKIDVVQRGRVRRAKLFYLRNLRGKKARIKAQKDFGLVSQREEAPEAAKA